MFLLVIVLVGSLLALGMPLGGVVQVGTALFGMSGVEGDPLVGYWVIIVAGLVDPSIARGECL